MKRLPFLWSYFFVAFLLAACSRASTVCETEPPNQPIEIRQALGVGGEAASVELAANLDGPVEIKVRNRRVSADRIVHGQLCDDHWSGIVYVDCDVQVAAWEESPTFFDDCDLEIEPNTVVYVAYHNDEAYYKGCSCHTSEGLAESFQTPSP